MDFYSFSRRELQALCKKNKIPANMTNVAMADALKALDFVEGIEEFLKPSESETTKSSIESPKKSEITSPSVPRTGCRTSMRRKTVKNEAETLHTLTRSRHTTRRMLKETPAEAAPTTRRRTAAAASVRRKIEIPSKESEEVEKEQKDVPETPAMVKASRRRGVKETSGIKHVYSSTRRSARLAEKNVDEKKTPEAIKIDSFAEEMDENLEINSKESSCQLNEVTDHNECDAETVSEEKSNLSGNGGDIEVGINDEEANNVEIIRAVLNSEAEGHINVKADDDGVEKKPEVDCEISDETDVHYGDNAEKLLDMENEVQENNGCEDVYKLETENALENEMNSDINNDEGSEFMADENLESKIPEVEGCSNTAVDFNPCKIEEQLELENVQIFGSDENFVIDIVIEDETEDVKKKDELTGENLDDNAEFESDFPNDMISTDEMNQEEEPDTEDVVEKDELIEENLDDNAKFKSEFPKDIVSANLFNQEEEPDTEDVVDKDELTGENLAENAELESDFPNDMISADKFNHEEEPDTEDASQLVMNMDDGIGPVSNGVFECKNLIKDAKQVTQGDTKSEKVMDAEKLAMETSGLQSAGSVALPSYAPLAFQTEFSGDAAESTLAANPSESASNPVVHPICMTPVKKNPFSTTTPMKKSAGRTPKTAKRVTIVSDDKENVDSGRKLVLTKKEKPKKKKEFAVTNNQKPLEELSMRQLTKMFKEKLEITKLNKSQADEIKAATTRPALRTLSENCLVGEPQN